MSKKYHIDIFRDKRYFRELPAPLKAKMSEVYQDHVSQGIDPTAAANTQRRQSQIGTVGVQTILDVFTTPVEELEKRQALPQRSYKAIVRRLCEILVELEHTQL